MQMANNISTNNMNNTGNPGNMGNMNNMGNINNMNPCGNNSNMMGTECANSKRKIRNAQCSIEFIIQAGQIIKI